MLQAKSLTSSFVRNRKNSFVLLFVVIAMLASMLISPAIKTAQADYSCGGFYPNYPGIFLYSEVNYAGTCQYLSAGDFATMSGTGFPDNSVKSIRIHGSYEARLYTGTNYSGDSSIYPFSSDNVGLERIGQNSVSSIKVYATYGLGEGMYVYDLPDGHGGWRYISFYGGDKLLPDISSYVPHDTLSSFRVVGPTTFVALYANTNYSGNYANINTSTHGNDYAYNMSDYNFDNITSSFIALEIY